MSGLHCQLCYILLLDLTLPFVMPWGEIESPSLLLHRSALPLSYQGFMKIFDISASLDVSLFYSEG
uniref:Uncharacterized protein n=1 Tax=Phlebia radiata TaxID=5308 RepID=L8B9H4_PHLRA|nr:hypothetical protein Pra_mt0314 [Phlebia radiata]CCF07382.1 hypothetical protein Pra_mt0314 [Phlebia radiata]